MKSILLIGMDVHKNTYSLCAMDGRTGELLGETRCGASVQNIKNFIQEIQSNLDEVLEVKAGYEAGCLGYSLYKELKKENIECEILAPSTMQKSAKNKVKKNDKLDARNIASNLNHGDYKTVYVPDEKDEEIKEYIRMLNDFKKSLKTVKQQIKALVLRHGFKYDKKACWTEAYIKWLRNLELSDLLKEVMNEYLCEMESLNDKIARFSDKVEEFYHQERYEESISKLRCFCGIDTMSAMTIEVEISDFERFPNARAFSSYVGLTCGEHSSAEDYNNTGISKMGNSTVRKTIVECANALIKGNPYKKSKRLKARQNGQSADVIAYADKASERLQRRFKKLLLRGMPYNKAKTAIARELACFIWGMETGNIY